MQVLYVGNLNYKHRGERYYTQGAKLVNGLIRNGHNVFSISDRDIARSATPMGFKAIGKKFVNQYFVDVCKNFQPAFIVFHHADLIDADSVREVKKFLPDVKVAQFNVDPIFREHNIKMIRAKLDVVDATFITTAGEALKRFSNKNGFVAYTPNIVDTSMEWPKAFEISDQAHDIFWALRPTKTINMNDPRIYLPLYLQDSGKVDINYFGMNGKDVLMNADYYKELNNCRMGLNISVVGELGGVDISKPEELYLYSSDRIAHYMGSGLLTFTTDDNKLEEIFEPEKEIIIFKDKEDLLDKILYYKKHDDKRKKVAEAGWKKSLQELNEMKIAKYFEDSTFNRKLENYIWPTEKF